MNAGAINLNGGLITGSALLSNSYGGTINGIGTILSPFVNAGGAILLTGGSLDISQAFTNSRTIQLNSFSATLSGGTITNASTIRGYGNISNNVVNNGIIESTGGMLTLSGSNQNLIAGLITADAGTKVLMASGLANNLGVINALVEHLITMASRLRTQTLNLRVWDFPKWRTHKQWFHHLYWWNYHSEWKCH